MLNTISATFGRAALAVSSVLTDSSHSHFTSFDLVGSRYRFEVLTYDVHRLGLEVVWPPGSFHLHQICFRFK